MNPIHEYCNIPWKESFMGLSGRVLVRLEMIKESRLDIYNYEGSKLWARHLFAVFNIALPQGWIEDLERLHQNRKTRWKTEILVSPSGEREYRLYTMGKNEPVCSSAICVSDKQIHTFSICLKDTAPLLKIIFEDYPPVFLPRYRRSSPNTPAFYYVHDQTMKFHKYPEAILNQRERTRRIDVAHDIFDFGTFEAGEKSGIMETIDAIKCLEVLQA
ncbi:hypothetical protein [Desulfosporosinus sp. FKA]|uniref:hypothetical protein n=1 Tax=Desulfosporosinus sp. FKA TaxID=1969834 RepID=UPI000B49C254|nr:hypothetical protein [Desulfosporosinus sp. FKA]